MRNLSISDWITFKNTLGVYSYFLRQFILRYYYSIWLYSTLEHLCLYPMMQYRGDSPRLSLSFSPCGHSHPWSHEPQGYIPEPSPCGSPSGLWEKRKKFREAPNGWIELHSTLHVSNWDIWASSGHTVQFFLSREQYPCINYVFGIVVFPSIHVFESYRLHPYLRSTIKEHLWVVLLLMSENRLAVFSSFHEVLFSFKINKDWSYITYQIQLSVKQCSDP